MITRRPKLPRRKWYLVNPPVNPAQQYPSDTHLQTDWYPLDCCLPDHPPLCTIHQPSFISCLSISILLAVADANRELLHIEMTMAGVIVYLCP